MKRAMIAGLAAAALLLTVPGTASAGDDEVRREGACSGNSEWEMRVKDEGNLRVRWRVDSGVPGQSWRLKLFHNGALIANATRTTNADGEATINLRNFPDAAGPDQFSGTARNLANGETCQGSATI
jgi:hypothetical protein